jgi:2-polyprenyl-3-methyl-5-hydroxy-6-metoxy-1,4-benzoquinol methylase
MRMMYSFGRRYEDCDFFLIPKVKTEQFRARNSIVESALRIGADYLLFLDDDHVFSWKETLEHSQYDFLRKLLDHKKDIVGCLYFHRSGEYKPVLMKKFKDDKYMFLNDSEITKGLQQVDVQGGGVMLIDMKIFDKILPPYFEPEMQTEGENFGTDIQLCRKARDAGFGVWCDTSIVVGHIRAEADVVTPYNRTTYMAQNAVKFQGSEDWAVDKWMQEYRNDVREYTGLTDEDIVEKAIVYDDNSKKKFHDYENKNEYYKNLGVEQLCRNAYYHSKQSVALEGLNLLNQFRPGRKYHGIDFGCGTGVIGFELLRRGYSLDFIDIDGAPSYEFLKWRIEKSDYKDRAGWSISGPYEFALFMDVIEHLKDWKAILDNVVGRIVEKGVLFTNFFANRDFKNPEHINMNHSAVMDFLISRHMVPKSEGIWIKDDNFMGPMNIETERKK